MQNTWNNIDYKSANSSRGTTVSDILQVDIRVVLSGCAGSCDPVCVLQSHGNAEEWEAFFRTTSAPDNQEASNPHAAPPSHFTAGCRQNLAAQSQVRWTGNRLQTKPGLEIGPIITDCSQVWRLLLWNYCDTIYMLHLFHKFLQICNKCYILQQIHGKHDVFIGKFWVSFTPFMHKFSQQYILIT